MIQMAISTAFIENITCNGDTSQNGSTRISSWYLAQLSMLNVKVDLK